jgi:hypothetical protein
VTNRNAAYGNDTVRTGVAVPAPQGFVGSTERLNVPGGGGTAKVRVVIGSEPTNEPVTFST